MCDAAIALLAQDGARGLSHLKVDSSAGVPAGTTSFNYRTRSALLHAVAARVSELDMADLAAAAHESANDAASATSALARAIFACSTEPRLSRTRARYELLLHAGRDPELAAQMRDSAAFFLRLSRAGIQGLQRDAPHVPADVLYEQTLAAMAFVEGVMVGFARGDRTIRSAEHIDALLGGIVAGVAETRTATHRTLG